MTYLRERAFWSKVCTYLSVALAAGAALAWFWATQVEVEHRDMEQEGGWHEASVSVFVKGRQVDPFATAYLQNRWNALAAGLTGAATLFQGLGTLLSA